MISSKIKKKFEDVLREELLDDLSIYRKPHFFDEIPLYSRDKQVEFLKAFGNEANLLLIEFSLEYLRRVVFDSHSKVARFIAITVARPENGEYVIPRIFVCNGNVREKLGELQLLPPEDRFARQISDLVHKAAPTTEFNVLQDKLTIPGDVRVFISYKSLPMGLVNFEKIASGNFVATEHQAVGER